MYYDFKVKIPEVKGKIYERTIKGIVYINYEYDRVYTEREVNIIIADYFDDFCTIRRDMISENLLDRDAGKYWRVKA